MSNTRIMVRGGTYDDDTDTVNARELELNQLTWTGLHADGQVTIDFTIGEVSFEDFSPEQVKEIRKLLKQALKEAAEA